MLHGFGSFLETWVLNFPPLSRLFRVYVIDLPGHGLSDRSEVCYQTGSVSDYTSAIMDALKIERASFIGHSLGGLVGLQVALKLPERVDKLILVDSAGLSTKMPLAYRLASVPVLGKLLMSVAFGSAFERSMRKMFSSSDALSEDMLGLFMDIFYRVRTADSLISILHKNVGLRGPHPEIVIVEKLGEIKSLTLFVHGARDRIFPLSQVEPAFKMIPHATARIFSECGHCPHIERVVEFNELAMSFLTAG